MLQPPAKAILHSKALLPLPNPPALMRLLIKTPQEHAQLTTISELVEERQQARKLKRCQIPTVAVLHSYFYGDFAMTTNLDNLLPWKYTSLNTNKTTKLRWRIQPIATIETTAPTGRSVIYTEAAVNNGGQ